MKTFFIVVLVLALVYLGIGLGIYLMIDPGTRGPIEQWLIGWPIGLIFASHVS